MVDWKKGGKNGNTKIWIPQEQKELFRWYEKHFSYLFKAYHLVKNWIVDTSIAEKSMCLNFCSCRWFKPNHTPVNIFIPKYVINIEGFPFNRSYKF